MLKAKKRQAGGDPDLQDPKKFIIPRKSTKTQLVVEKLLDSRESVDLIRVVRESFLNPSFPMHINRVQFINNEQLGNEYAEKRRSLKEEGRIPSEMVEIYGFRFLTRGSLNLCINKGLIASEQRRSFYTLGDPKYGVYLSRSADLISKRALPVDSDIYVVVFRVLKGRVKVIGEQTDALDNLMEPTPNYDGHFSKEFPNLSQSTASNAQLVDSSQMYLYEFELGNIKKKKDDSIYAKRPRQCLPYAIITFRYTPKVTVQPPLPTQRYSKTWNQEEKGASAASKDDDSVSANETPQEEHILWNGAMYNKDKFLANVNITSSSLTSLALPFVGSMISVSTVVKLSSLSGILPKCIFKQSQGAPHVTKASTHGYSYMCCGVKSTDEQCPVLDMLTSHLIRQQQAVMIEFSQGTLACFIPTCALTEQLGMTPHDSPIRLHALFICKEKAAESSCQASRAFYLLQQRMMESRLASIESIKAHFSKGMPTEGLSKVLADGQSSSMKFTRLQLEQIPGELMAMCKSMVAQLVPSSSIVPSIDRTFADRPSPSTTDVCLSDTPQRSSMQSDFERQAQCIDSVSPPRSEFDFSYGNHFANVHDSTSNPATSVAMSHEAWCSAKTPPGPVQARRHSVNSSWNPLEQGGNDTADMDIPCLLDLRHDHPVDPRLSSQREAVIDPRIVADAVQGISDGIYNNVYQFDRFQHSTSTSSSHDVSHPLVPAGLANHSDMASLQDNVSNALPPWFETVMEHVGREGWDRSFCLHNSQMAEEIARKHNLHQSLDNGRKDFGDGWLPDQMHSYYHSDDYPITSQFSDDDHDIPVVTVYQPVAKVSPVKVPASTAAKQQFLLNQGTGTRQWNAKSKSSTRPVDPRLSSAAREPSSTTVMSNDVSKQPIESTTYACTTEATTPVRSKSPYQMEAGMSPITPEAPVTLRGAKEGVGVGIVEKPISAIDSTMVSQNIEPEHKVDEKPDDPSNYLSDMDLSSLTSDDEGGSLVIDLASQDTDDPVMNEKEIAIDTESVPPLPPITSPVTENRPPLPPSDAPERPKSDGILSSNGSPDPVPELDAGHAPEGTCTPALLSPELVVHVPKQTEKDSPVSESLDMRNILNDELDAAKEVEVSICVDAIIDDPLVTAHENTDRLIEIKSDTGIDHVGKTLCVTVKANAAHTAEVDNVSSVDSPSPMPRVVVTASSKEKNERVARDNRKRWTSGSSDLDVDFKRRRSLSPISHPQKVLPIRWDSSSNLADNPPSGPNEEIRDLRDILRKRGLEREPKRPRLSSTSNAIEGSDRVTRPLTERITIERRWTEEELDDCSDNYISFEQDPSPDEPSPIDDLRSHLNRISSSNHVTTDYSQVTQNNQGSSKSPEAVETVESPLNTLQMTSISTLPASDDSIDQEREPVSPFPVMLSADDDKPDPLVVTQSPSRLKGADGTSGNNKEAAEPQFEAITDEEDNAEVATNDAETEAGSPPAAVPESCDEPSPPDVSSVPMDESPGPLSSVSEYAEEWEVVSADVSPSAAEDADLFEVHRERLPSVDESVVDPHRLAMRAKAEQRLIEVGVLSEPSLPDEPSEPVNDVIYEAITASEPSASLETPLTTDSQRQSDSALSSSVVTATVDVNLSCIGDRSEQFPSPGNAMQLAVVGDEPALRGDVADGKAVKAELPTTSSSQSQASSVECTEDRNASGAPALGDTYDANNQPSDVEEHHAPGDQTLTDMGTSSKTITMETLSIYLSDFKSEWLAAHPEQSNICSEFLNFFQRHVLK